MNNGASQQSGCGFSQAFADQTPKYDNAARKRRCKWGSGVLNKKTSIIRPDRRKKTKYVT
jgi:hypothetical protein